MVEIAKRFLLFILLLSCLKPAGTMDDKDSASFLSDRKFRLNLHPKEVLSLKRYPKGWK